MAEPPQFQMISEPPSKMKFVAIAVVALILIVAGVWYFSHALGDKKEACLCLPKPENPRAR